MDTAAAIAQLKATMSAPTQEVACVVLRASGEVHEVTIDHRKVSEVLGGMPTMVGAVRSLEVTACALREQKKGKVTKHELPDSFDQGIKGDIVLLRTNEDAAPVAFTSKEYHEWVEAGRPDEAEDEDDEEEGEEFLEDDDEEEEGEEEDEEEEDAREAFEKMSDAELRKGCMMLQVSSEGTRDELIERMVEASAALNADSDDSDDDEDDDEDDEDDDEEDEAESTQARLAAMSEGELKEACKQLGLSSAGKRDALVARVTEAIAAAQQAEADDSDDSDEEEEEEEEELPEPASVPRGKGKAKASPATLGEKRSRKAKMPVQNKAARA